MKKLIGRTTVMLICSCVLFVGIDLTAEKPEAAKKKVAGKGSKKGGVLEKECGCKYKKSRNKKKERIIKKCEGCKKGAPAKKEPKKGCGKECKCAKCKKSDTVNKDPKKGCGKGCKCAKCPKKGPKKAPGKGRGVEVIVLPDNEKEIPPGMEKGSDQGQEKKKESGNAWWKFW